MDDSRFEKLRAQAERILSEEGASSKPFRENLEHLLHELEVYRIELELQNEELHHSQIKLEESRSNYYELYNLAPIAFLNVSPEYPYPVITANSMARRLLGADREYLRGASFTGFAAAEDARGLHRFVRRLHAAHRELTDEFLMQAKSPSRKFHARVQGIRVTNRKRQDRIYIALADISDLVRAREILRKDRDQLEQAVRERTIELEGANRELGQKNRELQDFAFIASHDLREPIRKVLTFGSILEDRYVGCLDENARDYLKRMKNASQRMERMLSSLLEYSRLDTRGKPFEKISLGEVMAQVQSILSEEIDHSKGRLRVGDLPSIEAEPQQMVQLFLNLVANAIKFTEAPPEITVYAENGSDRCTIFVVDNGIGFETKYLDKIFAPFERLHARQEYEGTGMGLTICRKIVERHKGAITATSTPGVGSVFIINLPYRQ